MCGDFQNLHTQLKTKKFEQKAAAKIYELQKMGQPHTADVQAHSPHF